jgi:hypothetical protein
MDQHKKPPFSPRARSVFEAFASATRGGVWHPHLDRPFTARLEELAEKLAVAGTPQALKREHIFDGLAARVKLVPFPKTP